MPDDAKVIARVDMDDVRRSGMYEKFKQANPAAESQIQQGLSGTSLRFEDIASIAIGGSLASQDKVVALIQTSRSISESEMAGSTTNRTENVGEYTIYYEPAGAAVRIDDRTLLGGNAAMIKAILAREGPARLFVVDVQGRRVAEIFDAPRHDAGRFETRWDLRDGRGRRVAPGTYFFRLEGAGASADARVVVVR